MSKLYTGKKKSPQKETKRKNVELLAPEVDYMVLEIVTVIREVLFTFIHVTLLWTSEWENFFICEIE